MSEIIVAPNPMTNPENSDNAVRERFSKSILDLPPEQRGNIRVSEPDPNVKSPIEKSALNPVKEPEKKVETKTDEVPSEFFEDKKVEVDEWRKITDEDQKGHITGDHWKNYKGLTKAKVEALEKELAEARKKIPSDDFMPEKYAKERETLQKQLKERDDILTRKYIQETPQFKERFTNKEGIITRQIEKLGKELSLEPDQVHAILNAPLKRRLELVGEIESAGGQSAISSLLSQRDQLQDEKSDFLAEHEKNTAGWEEQERIKSDAEKSKQKELYDHAFNETVERLKDFGPLKKIAGQDAWNKAIDDDIALAKSMYNGENFTPQQDAEMFLTAVSAKRLMKMFETASQRAKAAEKELTELKAAGPSASQAQNGNGGDPHKGMTPDERAARTFNEARANASNNGFSRR